MKSPYNGSELCTCDSQATAECSKKISPLSPARDRRDDAIEPVAERIRVVVGKGRDGHHARAYALNGRLQVCRHRACVHPALNRCEPTMRPKIIFIIWLITPFHPFR